MIDADYIARIKRDRGLDGLRAEQKTRLLRARDILNPFDPRPFHGLRAESVRLLIAEAEMLSQAIAQDAVESKAAMKL